jgi:hypothetical protein
MALVIKRAKVLVRFIITNTVATIGTILKPIVLDTAGTLATVGTVGEGVGGAGAGGWSCHDVLSLY